jgi:hypothetical protein
MILNKKGVQSHMLIIVIVSAFMTLLILSVLSTIFISDPIACQKLDFEIGVDTCKDGKILEVHLTNLAEGKVINLNINNYQNVTLEPSRTERFKIPNQNNDESYVIIPFFEDIQGSQLCNGKKKKTNNIDAIKKC